MSYVPSSCRKKVDRRVAKTKRALFDAFDRLAREKDYGKITISELAREADIDRKTFYLHYSSIEEMLEDKVSEIVESILDEVELDMQRRAELMELTHADAEGVKPDARVFFAGVNSAVKNLLPSCAHFLGDAPFGALLERIGRPLAAEIKRRESLGFTISDELLEIYVFSLVGCMLGAYGAWFKEGMTVPAEDVFDISSRLVDVCVQEIDDAS